MINEHFMCVVAGDNPDEIMRKYSNATKVEPYRVYRFDSIPQYRKQKLEIYNALLDQPDIDEKTKECIRCDIEQINSEDDIDFYTSITENLKIDEKTGDAYSDINLNGKFDACTKGVYDALELKDAEGNTSCTMLKKDIDFDHIHLFNQESFALAWELCMENKKPKDEEEKILKDRVKDWKNYFSRFGSKKKYVLTSTAFWAQVFTDGNEWYEKPPEGDQYEWIGNFYDRFIKPLNGDTRLTVYECMRLK